MRDISKLPNLPYLPLLNEKIVRIITAMLFIERENTVSPNTLLQIMGNITFLLDMVKEFPSEYKNVLVSGGKNPNYKENNQEVGLVKQLYTSTGNDWNDVFEKVKQKLSKVSLIKRALIQRLGNWKTNQLIQRKILKNQKRLVFMKELKIL